MKPELEEPPHEKYLVQPMRRIAAFSTRHPAARARRRGGALAHRDRSGSATCASTPTTSTSSARDHPLGQSARVIDDELSGDLQLPDHARGAAGIAEHARRAAAHGSPGRRAAEAAERQEGPVGRRLRAAGEQGAARRRSGGRRRPGRSRRRSRRSCSCSRSAAKGATSSSGSSPATTPARRSTSSCTSMSSDVVLAA